jgi:hypothetical protein
MAETVDRRETIREAMRSLAGDAEEVVEEAEEAPEPEQPEDGAASDDAAEGGEEPAPAKSRDDKGRFATGEKDKPVKSTPVGAEQRAAPAAAPKVEPAKPAALEVRAPQSLRPAAREAWAKLSANPDARPLLEDVARVEVETKRVLSENAGLRKSVGESQAFRQGVEQLVAPVSSFFATEGMNPAQGLVSLVNTYAALRGPRANEVLAGMIQQYGSIEGINAFLEGKPDPDAGRPQQPQRAAPQATQADPREIVRQEMAAARREAEVQQADAELDEFMRSANGGEPEFIRDVAPEMEMLFQAAQRQGRKLTFAQAYDRACKLNEDVQSILVQRAAAAAATTSPSAAPAQRARVAAATSKPRSSPGGGAPAVDPNDRRAMIERAMQRARSK